MRNYTHSPTFFSEDDKHIPVNRLSIGEAGLLSKEHTKKKKKEKKRKEKLNAVRPVQTTTSIRRPLV